MTDEDVSESTAFGHGDWIRIYLSEPNDWYAGKYECVERALGQYWISIDNPKQKDQSGLYPVNKIYKIEVMLGVVD